MEQERRGPGPHLPRAKARVPPATPTCVTMLVTSPALAGSRRVLESLASLEKALTYCSATESEAAALPCWGQKDNAQQRAAHPPEPTRAPPCPAPAGSGPRDGRTPTPPGCPKPLPLTCCARAAARS